MYIICYSSSECEREVLYHRRWSHQSLQDSPVSLSLGRSRFWEIGLGAYSWQPGLSSWGDINIHPGHAYIFNKKIPKTSVSPPEAYTAKRIKPSQAYAPNIYSRQACISGSSLHPEQAYSKCKHTTQASIHHALTMYTARLLSSMGIWFWTTKYPGKACIQD